MTVTGKVAHRVVEALVTLPTEILSHDLGTHAHRAMVLHSRRVCNICRCSCYDHGGNYIREDCLTTNSMIYAELH